MDNGLKRTHSVMLRLNTIELEMMREAIELSKVGTYRMSMSEWFRTAAREAASRILKEPAPVTPPVPHGNGPLYRDDVSYRNTHGPIRPEF